MAQELLWTALMYIIHSLGNSYIVGSDSYRALYSCYSELSEQTRNLGWSSSINGELRIIISSKEERSSFS